MRILIVEDIDLRKNDGPKVHFLSLYKSLKSRVETLAVVPRFPYFSWDSILGKFRYLPFFIKAIKLERRFCPDLVYLRLSPLMPLLLPFIKKRIILEVNAPLDKEALLLNRDKRIAKLIKSMCQQALRKADKVFAVSEEIKKEIINSGIGCNKVFFFENGTDLDHFRPIERSYCLNKLKLSEEFLYIGFVGNLVPWQGVATLLSAYKKVVEKIPHSRLLIVGDGIERQKLKTLSDGLPVKFFGSVDYEEVPYYINAFDCAVAPFLKEREGIFSPLKVKDYAACGVASVCSDIKGIPLYNERPWPLGLLCEPNNEKSLADGIIKLLTSPNLRQAIGKRAREYAVKFFSWDTIVDNMMRVLNGN